MPDEVRSTDLRSTEPNQLPIAVLGAGPVGLAAAAQLLDRGLTPIVFEAGNEVAASVREWGHVRMFSPWGFNVDSAAADLLQASGWTRPDESEMPTGRDLVERYLEPLAATPAMAPHLRLGARVVSVGRRGIDKVKDRGRESAPFRLQVANRDGEVEVHDVRAVIDATGTWTSPNPIGAGGVEAPGEHAARGRIRHGIPDVLGADRQRHAGRRTLVVGSGHSAFNVLLDLGALRRDEPSTEIVWAIRRKGPETLYGGGESDALPARGALGLRLRRLVEDGSVTLLAPFEIERLSHAGERLRVEGASGDAVDVRAVEVDEVVAATGARPDLSFLREVRLDLDPALECAAALAPLIDPNVHSCGTVRPHGEHELRHAEDGFYMVGVKSYGRAPTFLLATGYEQVRSIAAALAGDREAADRLELDLPETGVCSSNLFEVPEPTSCDVGPGATACCGAEAAP